MKIPCSFCGRAVSVEEYDYARFCKGEMIWCEECYQNFKEGISETMRIR